MKRYSITDYHTPEMSEDEDGGWVKWEDWQTEMKRLKKELNKALQWIKDEYGD